MSGRKGPARQSRANHSVRSRTHARTNHDSLQRTGQVAARQGYWDTVSLPCAGLVGLFSPPAVSRAPAPGHEDTLPQASHAVRTVLEAQLGRRSRPPSLLSGHASTRAQVPVDGKFSPSNRSRKASLEPGAGPRRRSPAGSSTGHCWGPSRAASRFAQRTR